ncbi:hypothetical protein BJV82DRAFT_625491 [Fennellomyces sp. T-0311]|nr:hypothetical protein BJV82DRAFT_625491 [Fennellomyces sp. T-0311]
MRIACHPCETKEALPMRDGNQELQRWQQQMAQLDSETNTLHTQITNLEPVSTKSWDLCVIDGNVHLETPIRSLDELLRYNQASIRYLSPFQQLFRREHIQFKGVSTSVALASTGLIIRYATPRNQPRHIMYHGLAEMAHKWMDSLVDLYMERFNPYVGLLHRQSFLEHYHGLDDPLSSAIALAVCVDTIAYFYPQLEYSMQEKRDVAEFFYVCCRDKLLEMYDDPSQQLEAVISTNLLMQYLMDVLLEFAEARRLITIALLVCHDLEFQELSLVQNALFQRARSDLQICMCNIDLIVDDKFDYSRVQYQRIFVLDDEPQSTRVYFTMWKHILEFVGSRYATTLAEHAWSSVLHGKECELSLDLVLQFEPTIQAWWKSLPTEFRLCDDPFNLKAVRQAIESAPSSTHMMPLALIHVTTAAVQSTFLQPQSSIPEQANSDVINILRQRALYLTLCSTQALIHVMVKNLEVDIEAMPLSFGYMMGILHAICNIVSCLRLKLPPEMQNMLSYCFDKLRSVVPLDHHIPEESVTKLQSFVITRRSNPIVIYESYPIPRLAMLSDIFQTCFRHMNSLVSL